MFELEKLETGTTKVIKVEICEDYCRDTAKIDLKVTSSYSDNFYEVLLKINKKYYNALQCHQ